MRDPKSSAQPAGWKMSFVSLVLAVACFNLAYASTRVPVLSLFIFGYAIFLIQLTNQPTVRRAFYFGLAAGFAAAASQAFFFWKIFSVAAVVLWLVFGFWIGIFAAISWGCINRWGKAAAVWVIPIIWTGTEFFRSELYYLKFSWLNVGYAFSNVPDFPFRVMGMYGVGFVVFSIAAVLCFRKNVSTIWTFTFWLGVLLVVYLAWFVQRTGSKEFAGSVEIAGVQMEFPPENVIPEVLDEALARNTNAAIFVLSEYTLDGGVTDLLRKWCRSHSRFLVLGGRDIVTNDVYYDTAFVVGTNGKTVFKQAKSVPIQFFNDGLPARRQDVWNSPWGKIGICICYDLSYTRVTDALVTKGAQMIIVPTMDIEDWGRHEHELHSRVAPVRAAEYGIPIFRVASSGISQAVSSRGRVLVRTAIPGDGEIFFARMLLPARASIPLDRLLAPFCVIVTGVITAVLLFLSRRGGRAGR